MSGLPIDIAVIYRAAITSRPTAVGIFSFRAELPDPHQPASLLTARWLSLKNQTGYRHGDSPAVQLSQIADVSPPHYRP